ncbi:MAG: DNA recombination protein RmuC [Dokdonella sp.]
MPDSSLIFSTQNIWIGIAAIIGIAVGALLAVVFMRRHAVQAFAAGRASRDSEVTQTAAELKAALDSARAVRTDMAQVADDRDAARTDNGALGNQVATLSARLEQLTELRRDLATALSESERWREAARLREKESATIATRLHEQQIAMEEKFTLLAQAREDMRVQFKAISDEMLEDKAKRMHAQNSEQLGQLLNPLREQIGDFRKLVSESYEKEGNARVSLQTELKGQLERLLELNQKLSVEATSLTRALTSDNRTQGYWGELKLERLLESAGLEKGQQYLTQESFSDADGDRYRPDAVLLLPEGRHIVIDAKMALVEYQRFCDATDEGEREQHLGRHIAAVRNHVRQLGEKDYTRLEGMQSPELVLMFVPVEAAFLEAIRRDNQLYEDAFQRKIILVGPGNLLASLRLVAQIWRTEQQNRNAKQIADRAAALYDKFSGFVDDMGKIGEALDRAQKAHQAALGKLSQGRGNLLRKVEQLRGLGAAPSKSLPQSLLDASTDSDLDDEDAMNADPPTPADPPTAAENEDGAE